jgi:N6-adenosine-specific RNA methylase IME4
MTVKEIVAAADFVKGLTDPDGCHLYLWVTNNFLPAGFEVMGAWGFEYVTCVTWFKDRMGLGQYFRGKTEHCLFGVTSRRLPYRLTDDGKRAQGVTGFAASRTEHSKKPDEMRCMIKRVSYPPYIELFARTRTEGWDAWGLEVQPCE